MKNALKVIYLVGEPRSRMFLGLFSCCIFLNGCAPSSSPVSEELVKTSMPSFIGGQSATFTTPTATFTLYGTCDPISKGLQWSYDNQTWQPIQSGCVQGGFSLQILVPKFRFVYVRALTKMGYTEAAVARVRFTLPPTAPTFQVVSAGSSVDDGDLAMQFTMSGTSDGRPMSSATHRLDSHATGVVYGP